MRKKMFVVPGKFVPSNDTVTLLTYKRLKHLDMDFDVFALKDKEDIGIKKELDSDNNFKKFNIKYFCEYDNTVCLKKPYLLPIGIINMKRYISRSLKEFEKSNYDFLYTSSIPCVSHLCGALIKKKHPEITWIASFSDPIKNAPYNNDPNLKKRGLLYRIMFKVGSYIYMNQNCEKVAIKNADQLIFISEEQRNFTLKQHNDNGEYLEKSKICNLCYDEDWSIYKKLINNNKKNVSYPKQAVHLGRLYGLRKIDTFLEALKELKQEDNNLSKEIVFHQYSEIQKEEIDYINSNNLNDVFIVHDKVSYLESLKTMKKADVLVLFDTIIDEKEIQPYLPSKIVEYLLLNKPILAICGSNSPSYKLLKKYGHNYIGTKKNQIKENIVSLINNKDYCETIELEELKSKYNSIVI